ncbi:hypothetical protein M436DRAFT_63772 [Aureobasidium namibiae CBS 147.97]|uniref:Uncharacterized protein n=1 Tax=Aureobasidium namibiae CBS 147.97 TaxID=1043004 RepID=A0A074XFV7_9PEZI
MCLIKRVTTLRSDGHSDNKDKVFYCNKSNGIRPCDDARIETSERGPGKSSQVALRPATSTNNEVVLHQDVSPRRQEPRPERRYSSERITPTYYAAYHRSTTTSAHTSSGAKWCCCHVYYQRHRSIVLRRTEQGFIVQKQRRSQSSAGPAAANRLYPCSICDEQQIPSLDSWPDTTALGLQNTFPRLSLWFEQHITNRRTENGYHVRDPQQHYIRGQRKSTIQLRQRQSSGQNRQP